MSYPTLPNDTRKKLDQLRDYATLQHEYGATGIQEQLDAVTAQIDAALAAVQALPIDAPLKAKEPDDLEAIHALRTPGPRAMAPLSEAAYREKLEGAMLSRFAGCTLGAIVEFWSVDAMRDWAAAIGDSFPPTDYWSKITNPIALRYQLSPCSAYTRGGMDGVPVDDDIAYTLLGLLIAEDYGLDFTTDDVGEAWKKYLPYACTAEEVALDNLRAGVPALLAAEKNNPYIQWIGADIRSDPFAYLAPAQPEKAAAMAYRDAYVSHRRNGIYGEMFFAAAQAAAFAAKDSMEALRIALTEIPRECTLYGDVVWALETAPSIHDYIEARAAVEDRFAGMSGVHTNLNACLTIFGLSIGGNDVTRVISETVAMGYDNDCTAATAGSIVGAIVGKAGVPEHWYRDFNNTVHSYLIDRPLFHIDDLIDRFTKLAL